MQQATLTATPTAFDRTTAITPGLVAGTFQAELDPSWSSLRGVHGGYVAGIAVRAAQATEPGRAVRTVTMTFIRPAEVGPAELEVRPLRQGRSMSTLDVDCRQQGRVVSTARITMVDALAGTEWDGPPVHPVAVPRSACVPLLRPEHVRHLDQADAVIDPAQVPFTGCAEARLAGYVRPLEARPIDAPWLAMLLDWFPPSSFTKVDPPTGGVSVEYTVHLHRTIAEPSPDLWLAAAFRADVARGGLALEHGVVADPDGRPVAECFHTRWTG